MTASVIIKPHEGPQTDYLASKADIVFFGGGAGGGKSRGLLHDAARYHKVKGFGAVIFRRTSPEITNEGGLWDESQEMYRDLGGIPREGMYDWQWPEYRSSISFSHMQHLKDMYSWKGSQLAFIGWDEITSFEEAMFWYLLSRLRSTCGVSPCVRCTTNPEPGSWVAEFLDWWIGEDGYPVPVRDGILRWFVRVNGVVQWADNRAELPTPERAMSVTFIRSTLEDNPTLMEQDPSYLSKLEALPLYERMILRGGNWKVTRGGGMRFRRDWFPVVDFVPKMKRIVRYWDRASTDEIPKGQIAKTGKTPDQTSGCLMGEGEDGLYYVLDDCTMRGTPHKVLDTIDTTATQDEAGKKSELWLEQDPAQAGVAERHHLSKALAQYGPKWIKADGSKWVRSGPFSAAAENKLVRLVRGPWNKAWLDEHVAFVDETCVKPPPGYHDDRVDASSGAFGRLTNANGVRLT